MNDLKHLDDVTRAQSPPPCNGDSPLALHSVVSHKLLDIRTQMETGFTQAIHSALSTRKRQRQGKWIRSFETPLHVCDEFIYKVPSLVFSKPSNVVEGSRTTNVIVERNANETGGKDSINFCKLVLEILGSIWDTHHIDDSVGKVTAGEVNLLLDVDAFFTKECSDMTEYTRMVLIDDAKTGGLIILRLKASVRKVDRVPDGSGLEEVDNLFSSHGS
mmetsp:Transcript_30742/g.74941  ORF Transcript_30742/g.74941 Transcript_30742/m.74941 type:complete len:217 (+) Transcript_30742:51-701(+)